MRQLNTTFIVVAVLLTGIVTVSLHAFNLPKWFPFSNERALQEWEEKIFKGRVTYTVEHGQTGGALHALSKSTASAIFYRLDQRYRVSDYPYLSWKWKVVRFPDQEKLRGRQGIEKDDYAARVYVIFPAFNFMASKVLEYIWDEAGELERVSDSPYSGNIKLIVVQTGSSQRGEWVTEERNVRDDYRRAFGREPTLRVGAIALMSDADNSQDVSEAYFDDIRVGYREER